jgi:Cu+-exporting ATPase
MSTSIAKQLKKVGMHIEPETKALDVVCGMELDPSRIKLHVEHQGEVYYFCNPVCKNHFVNDAEKYVGFN